MRIIKLTLLAICIVASPTDGYAYLPVIHETLTRIAGERFNECAVRKGHEPLKCESIGNIVKGVRYEDDQFILKRLLTWHFYDRSPKKRESIICKRTRLHARFDELSKRVNRSAPSKEAYSELGKLIHYLQDVTVPAHAIPIFHPTPILKWPFTKNDSFDEFAVQKSDSTDIANEECDNLLEGGIGKSYNELLSATAQSTLNSISEPIGDTSETWSVFWQLSEPGSFGCYGPEGNNFGKAIPLDCEGEACNLEEGDPIYVEYAKARHLEAIDVTIRAILNYQQRAGVLGQSRSGD